MMFFEKSVSLYLILSICVVFVGSTMVTPEIALAVDCSKSALSESERSQCCIEKREKCIAECKDSLEACVESAVEEFEACKERCSNIPLDPGVCLTGCWAVYAAKLYSCQSEFESCKNGCPDC